MKTAKKMLSILLAVLMIISIVPVTSIEASAASGSDYTSNSVLAAKLDAIFSGDIDIYSNSACTSEVYMPVGTSMSNSTQYWVKSNTTGNTCSGWQCYIYANAVYNKLYNEWVGHGNSFAHSEKVVSGGASTLSYATLYNAGVRCGAYLRTTNQSSGAYNGNAGHSMIILSYNASNITYLEGNGDGNGAIRITTKTWSDFNYWQLSGKSRYVAHIVQPTDSYYNSIYPSTPPTFTKTASILNLTLGGTESGTVDVSYRNGSYPNPCEINFKSNNTSIVTVSAVVITAPSYGSASLSIIAKGVGTTSIDVWIVDTVTNKIITTDFISVNVNANTYTVYYNANGGTGAPASQTKTHGTDLTLSTTKPTRTGYTFLGWSTSSSATSATYSAGNNFTTNANTTLYAVWKANTYTVSYNANGGTGAPSSQTKTHEVDLTLSSQKPTRTGYMFVGWATNPDATSATYSAGDSFTSNVNTTLYAVWWPVMYTISYNANGGAGAPSSQTKTYGKTLTLSSTIPTRTGYTFLGWSTSSTATSATYSAGDSFTTNANTTLYAVWKANTYTVSYNANGGAGAPSSQTKTYGKTLTLSNTIPTRTGYTFLGWSTSPTATSATYSAGDSFTTNANTTLYAVWKANTYTISYNANGGTGAPSSQAKTYGKTLTLSSTIPTRTGYTFLGWSTSSTATTATYSPGGSFTTDANTTLYAVWKKNAVELTANSSNNAVISNAGDSKYFTYTPTISGTYVIYSTSNTDTRVYLYNSSGVQLASDDDSGEGYNFRLQYNMTAGTTYRFEIKYYNSSNTGTIPFKFGNVFTVTYNAKGGTGAPSSQYKDYGATLTLSSSIPTRTGYTFLGWSTSSTATSATYSAGASFTTNATTTLYAVWKANTYTVSYNANGGTGAPSSQTKTHEVDLTLSSQKPTRTGYMFVGWATNPDATSATYSAGDSFTTNANTTLYAVWKANTYTVSYNANGGAGAPSSQTKTYGKTLTLSSTIPTRTGYTFLGWSTSSSATSATYSAGDSFTTNANTTLYAVWEKAGHDINNDGIVNSNDTGLYKYNDTWYYVKNGDIDYTFTGLTKHTNGIWYYVENGVLDWSHTGLVKHTNGVWYYVQKGQLNWKHTGLVKHTNGIWYYVQNGQLNWSKTGLVKHTNGIWYYVQKGQLNWNKTGLVKHTDGNWYYVQKGQINWNYTGLVKHTNGKWYYVQKGKLNWNYTGYAYYNGKKYKVVKGEKV